MLSTHHCIHSFRLMSTEGEKGRDPSFTFGLFNTRNLVIHSLSARVQSYRVDHSTQIEPYYFKHFNLLISKCIDIQRVAKIIYSEGMCILIAVKIGEVIELYNYKN